MPIARLKDLERALARIPPHPAPKAELEQYATPADVAAPLLWEAHARGDLEGRAVVDLGCGTGVFAIGAALLGASPVTAVDVDEASLRVGQEAARRAGVEVTFVRADVAAWRGRADTVLMNPPFGAQVPHADRPFFAAAFATSDVVYAIHGGASGEWIERTAQAAGFRRTEAWALRLRLAHQYRHQEKASVEIDAGAVRLQKA